MVHQLTAAVLLALMTLVTATSQQGVNYCACLQEIFVSNCDCGHETEELAESGCSHSDHAESCCDEDPTDEVAPRFFLPDCHVSLFLETDEFANSVQELRSPVENGAGLSVPLSRSHFALSSAFPCKEISNRGPPGGRIDSPPVPLFIRHSVFRL